MASLNDNAGVWGPMRSASRLSPLQRAYLMGFRRARIYGHGDADALADPFEAVSNELSGLRRDLARLRAIDQALETDRGDTLQRGESAQGSRRAALSTDTTPSQMSRLMSKLRTWRQRERERAELARMSQAELHDIGVSSADHWAEISKPFWRK